MLSFLYAKCPVERTHRYGEAHPRDKKKSGGYSVRAWGRGAQNGQIGADFRTTVMQGFRGTTLIFLSIFFGEQTKPFPEVNFWLLDPDFQSPKRKVF